MNRARLATLLTVLVMPAGSWGGTAARAAVGGVTGLVAGTAVSLGVIVTRARLAGHYIESTSDLKSWQGAPIPAGLAAGMAAGVSGTTGLLGAVAGLAAGAAVGVPAGALAGAALSPEPEDRWAGGIAGGALAMLLGGVIGWARGRRRRQGGGRAGTVVGLVGAGFLLVGCGDAEPVPLVELDPMPTRASAVEDVVILVGDPGKARFRHYPIIPAVAAEVARWAERIGRDSAVTVLVLGDIVYPDGMHPPEDAGFAQDSARVADQVAMVRAPAALERDARLYFLAGNHDWGMREDREGARRLRNLGTFLDRARGRGANVDLTPVAGTGGPEVVDVGDYLRLVLLDTAWWIFDAEPGGKSAFVEGVAEAMAGAGNRRVVIAAHHPYETGGPHGVLVPVWRTLGLRWLLQKSGALLQDLSSRPYVELKRALHEVFRTHGRPFLFAGGHEHSLQLLAHEATHQPRYSVVSGSASKLTEVTPIPGTVFQRSAPGWIQLLIRENGAVDAVVMAAPERYLSCPENEPDELEWERCMERGLRAFGPVFTARLAGAAAATRPSARSTAAIPGAGGR